MICRVERCKDNAGYFKCMCLNHWGWLPWQLRRHISKNIRKNDFSTDDSNIKHLEDWALRIVNIEAGKRRISSKK